jgi:hypothetical protein
MTDEHRDPELESVWAEWQAPAPRAAFHARVLSAFEDEFVRAPWWRRRWVVAAAVAAVGVAMAVIVLRPNRVTHYEPVQQPHFMIVSAGEHP